MSLRDLVTDASCATDGLPSISGGASGSSRNPIALLVGASLDAQPGISGSQAHLGARSEAHDMQHLLIDEFPPILEDEATHQLSDDHLHLQEFFAAHPSLRRPPQLPIPPLPEVFPHFINMPYSRLPPPAPGAATALFEAAYAKAGSSSPAQVSALPPPWMQSRIGITPVPVPHPGVADARNVLAARNLYNHLLQNQRFYQPPAIDRALAASYAIAPSAESMNGAAGTMKARDSKSTEPGDTRPPVTSHMVLPSAQRASTSNGEDVIPVTSFDHTRDHFHEASGAFMDNQLRDILHSFEQLGQYPVVQDDSVESATRNWEQQFESLTFDTNLSTSNTSHPQKSRSTTRTASFANALAQLDGTSAFAGQTTATTSSDETTEERSGLAAQKSPSWSHEFTSFEAGESSNLDSAVANITNGNGFLDPEAYVTAGMGESQATFPDSFQSDLYDFLGRDPGATQYDFMSGNRYSALSTSQAIEEGTRMREEGHLFMAIQAFESALADGKLQGEEAARAWYLLGTTHAECDDDPRAIQAFLRCLKCYDETTESGERLDGHTDHPYLADSLLALGVSYTNELNVPKALGYLRDWLEARMVSKEASSSISSIHNELDAQEAMEGSRHGLHSVAYINDDVHQTEHRSLVARLERVINNNPTDVDVRIVLGVLYNLSREYDLAAESLRMAVTLRPDDARLWNKLGATLANGNESDDALRAYRKAVDLAPNYIRAWVNVGTAYANRGSFDKAARYYLRALSMYAVNDAERQRANASTMIRSHSVGDSDIIHVWGYLRTTLVALQRDDLLPLVDYGDVKMFREHFTF